MQVLAAFLLLELSKGPTSFWSPYLNALPKSYTTLSYFSPNEAEQLQVGAYAADECSEFLFVSMASASNTPGSGMLIHEGM